MTISSHWFAIRSRERRYRSSFSVHYISVSGRERTVKSYRKWIQSPSSLRLLSWLGWQVHTNGKRGRRRSWWKNKMKILRTQNQMKSQKSSSLSFQEKASSFHYNSSLPTRCFCHFIMTSLSEVSFILCLGFPPLSLYNLKYMMQLIVVSCFLHSLHSISLVSRSSSFLPLEIPLSSSLPWVTFQMTCTCIKHQRHREKERRRTINAETHNKEEIYFRFLCR